ncbi:hypothetical protein [Streptomyces sp. MNU103]|uniref:hypothetical protein n=1 Tax=Streptomyces sp. MNU103 TaxID=2560024 RepID=UPI001E351DE6|nr:hypothetical protein [Streptomyces sp. MNU103]
MPPGAGRAFLGRPYVLGDLREVLVRGTRRPRRLALHDLAQHRRRGAPAARVEPDQVVHLVHGRPREAQRHEPALRVVAAGSAVERDQHSAPLRRVERRDTADRDGDVLAAGILVVERDLDLGELQRTAVRVGAPERTVVGAGRRRRR